MSLPDMIKHNLISVNDTVFFIFKGNYFSAKILRGGLIGNCEMRVGQEIKPILESVTAFGSLTAWTEACLQDVLEEYYTRYSSWKRVNHKESKRSMGCLRDQCKLLSNKRKREEEIPELYKEIYRLQQTVTDMKQHIDKWESGQTPEHKNWESVSIRPVLRDNKINDAVKMRAQYILLGEPRGIDLELYKILNV